MGRPRRPVPPEGRHKLAIWLPRPLYRRLRGWAFFQERELSAMAAAAVPAGALSRVVGHLRGPSPNIDTVGEVNFRALSTPRTANYGQVASRGHPSGDPNRLRQQYQCWDWADKG